MADTVRRFYLPFFMLAIALSSSCVSRAASSGARTDESPALATVTPNLALTSVSFSAQTAAWQATEIAVQHQAEGTLQAAHLAETAQAIQVTEVAAQAIVAQAEATQAAVVANATATASALEAAALSQRLAAQATADAMKLEATQRAYESTATQEANRAELNRLTVERERQLQPIKTYAPWTMLTVLVLAAAYVALRVADIWTRRLTIIRDGDTLVMLPNPTLAKWAGRMLGRQPSEGDDAIAIHKIGRQAGPTVIVSPTGHAAAPALASDPEIQDRVTARDQAIQWREAGQPPSQRTIEINTRTQSVRMTPYTPRNTTGPVDGEPPPWMRAQVPPEIRVKKVLALPAPDVRLAAEAADLRLLKDIETLWPGAIAERSEANAHD